MAKPKTTKKTTRVARNTAAKSKSTNTTKTVRRPARKRVTSKRIPTSTTQLLEPNTPAGTISLDPELLEEIGCPDLRIELRTITPEEAQTILDHMNARNRHVSEPCVRKLVRAFAKGTWVFCGDTVKFMKIKGKWVLADGQHRMRKIVDTNTPETFIVVWGIPEAAQTAIDDLIKKRSGGDALTLAGVKKNANEIAAAMRLTISYDNGYPIRTQGQDITNPELVSMLDEYRNLEFSAAFTKARDKSGFMGAGSIQTAAHYLMARQDAKQANQFFEKMYTKVGFVDEHDQALITYNALERYFGRAKRAGTKTVNYVIFAYYLIGWNAMRSGRRVNTLSFRKPINNKKFPYIWEDQDMVRTNRKNASETTLALLLSLTPEQREVAKSLSASGKRAFYETLIIEDEDRAKRDAMEGGND